MKYLSLFLITALFFSCDQRVEIDYDQWGDQTNLTNVQIYKYEVDNDPSLYETVNEIGTVNGYRRFIVSNSASVDADAGTVSISIKAGETLDEAAFIIFHESMSVEPVGNTPPAGFITELAVGGEYTYRLNSANGAHRDWKINIIP